MRMLPVAIATWGLGMRGVTVAFLGWFGPRGLASIVFGLLVLEESQLPESPELLTIVTLTVALSVFAHGLTAWPGANRYADWYDAAHQPSMPESRARGGAAYACGTRGACRPHLNCRQISSASGDPPRPAAQWSGTVPLASGRRFDLRRSGHERLPDPLRGSTRVALLLGDGLHPLRRRDDGALRGVPGLRRPGRRPAGRLLRRRRATTSSSSTRPRGAGSTCSWVCWSSPRASPCWPATCSAGSSVSSMAALSAATNFASIPYYPLWSLTIIALDVFIIWAITHARRRAARLAGDVLPNTPVRTMPGPVLAPRFGTSRDHSRVVRRRNR